MDIDENKKRKVEEEPVVETLELEVVLQEYIEVTQKMAKIIGIISKKVIGFEKLFNSDLFKQ